MIPQFPKYKYLELSDREDIENITKEFSLYSDFNFISLYGWDTESRLELSILNNNLVIKFYDYITDSEFYSFIGKYNFIETCLQLINFSKTSGINSTLHLIPEESVSTLSIPHDLIIAEDRDNFDYILSIEDLINLKGEKFRGKKNFLNRFNNLYAGKINCTYLNLNDSHDQFKITELFAKWQNRKNLDVNKPIKELKAIKRLFNLTICPQLFTIGIFIENELIGFSINEIISKDYGAIHFQKANLEFVGAYTFLKHQSALDFNNHGCKYINYQQDMGIESLRKAKLSYYPVKFLKKYIVMPK